MNGRREADPSGPLRIAGIVLAAGLARRMLGANKLLAEVDGTPIVARVVDALAAASIAPIHVVVGHRQEDIRAALAGRDVRFVENPDYEEGLGASLRAGIASLDERGDRGRSGVASSRRREKNDVDGALVALGDMPWVRAGHVEALVASYRRESIFTISVPVHERRRGHPVLWSACHFAELRALGGDVGARALLERHARTVLEVPIDDAGIHLDVDTPEMLARAL